MLNPKPIVSHSYTLPVEHPGMVYAEEAFIPLVESWTILRDDITYQCSQQDQTCTLRITFPGEHDLSLTNTPVWQIFLRLLAGTMSLEEARDANGIL